MEFLSTTVYPALQASFLEPVRIVFDAIGEIGAKTNFVHLPDIDAQLQPVGESLGMQLSLFKYTVCLFLVFPFAFILKALPNKHLKHLLSFSVGLFLVQWIFAGDWIHSFVTALGTYLLAIILPKKMSAKVIFAFVMGYMVLSHIYRMYVSYLTGIFDFTGTQMVLTMKLTSFGYNIYDGMADKKNVFPEKPHENASKERMYADRRRFAITSLPNPLEFFGYVYCFTCILAGPAFEYKDYVSAIDGSAYIPEKKEGEDKKAVAVPSPLFYGFTTLAIAVICMALHLTVGGKYPMNKVYDPVHIASFPGHLERFFYTYVALFGERFKYYFVWKVAEAASIFAGFGFEGFDKTGKPKGWAAVENIHIMGFETAPNIQTLSRSWNKRTQGWLERYTYLRSGKSLLVTYFVSAVWHGLYPGFFIFFMSVPILTEIERLARVKINPIVVPGFDGRDLKTYPNSIVGKLYWAFCVCGTLLVTNFFVQVFPIQSWGRCTAALGSYFYFPHLAMVALFLVLKVIPSRKSDKKSA